MFRFTRRSAVGAIALIFVLAACSSAATSPSASEAQPSASVAPSAEESPAPSLGPTMIDESLGVEVAVDRPDRAHQPRLPGSRRLLRH